MDMEMNHVGAFEAKTHLSALLEQVSGGEEITITKHGKAIARLVPVAPETNEAEAAFKKMRALRANMRLGDDLDWKSLRDEGRK